MEFDVRRRTSACNTLALLALLVFFPIFAFAQPTHPKPESLAFSSERLGRLHDAMQRQVDEKSLAGVVTLLMRHGKLVEQRSYGVKDIGLARSVGSCAGFPCASQYRIITACTANGDDPNTAKYRSGGAKVRLTPSS
jgi:hypothetical protein